MVVAGYGGVVFLSCLLEEGSLFSQPVEDYPSHDEGSVSLPFLSAILSFMPLACLGFNFPHVCLPFCGFAFLSISVTASFLACCYFWDSFFGSPAFSSSQNISCFARLIARCLKNARKQMYATSGYLYGPDSRTGSCLRFLDIKQLNAPKHEMFREDGPVRLVCTQHNRLAMKVCTVHIFLGLVRM